MRFALPLAAVAVLTLAGCKTVDPAAFAKAVDAAYGHCERHIVYSVRVGALNPSSGAELTGNYRCPPKAPPEE